MPDIILMVRKLRFGYVMLCIMFTTASGLVEGGDSSLAVGQSSAVGDTSVPCLSPPDGVGVDDRRRAWTSSTSFPTAKDRLLKSQKDDLLFESLRQRVSQAINNAPGYNATVKYPDECFMDVVESDVCRERVRMYFEHVRNGHIRVRDLENFLYDEPSYVSHRRSPAPPTPTELMTDYPQVKSESSIRPTCRPLHESCDMRMERYLQSLGYMIHTINTRWVDQFRFNKLGWCDPLVADPSIDLAKIRANLIITLIAAGINPTDSIINEQLRPYVKLTKERYDPRIICSFDISWDL
jgi:hypothetical protein